MADPVNVKKLVADYGTIAAIVGAAVLVMTELKGLRLISENNSTRISAVATTVPSNDGVKAAILDAIRPLDRGMAEVQAEVRQLSERVRRLEEVRENK